jgi:predicted enzyme related to lactoylglutathione lyase
MFVLLGEYVIMPNQLVWVDIPVLDLDRAIDFLDSEGNRLALHSR